MRGTLPLIQDREITALEANAKKKGATDAQTFETTASYKVDKITFTVERVFREDAENISTILTRLICCDAEE